MIDIIYVFFQHSVNTFLCALTLAVLQIHSIPIIPLATSITPVTGRIIDTPQAFTGRAVATKGVARVDISTAVTRLAFVAHFEGVAPPTRGTTVLKGRTKRD